MLEERSINRNRRCLILALVACQVFLFFGLTTQASQVIPSPGWVDDYDPIASPDAVVGGKVKIALGPYPSSFNAITNYTYQSIIVFSHLYDQLMEMDPVTLAWSSKIASKIEVSDDQMGFTVHLNPKAKWSDGKPITSEDFKFTLATIMDPKNIVGPFRSTYDKFEEPEILDAHTFQIRAKELHWQNLNALAQFSILPKHALEGKDFNKVDFEFPVVSGRYEIEEIKDGIYVRFNRRSDWWLDDQKRYQGIDNFEAIEYRFYPEREMIFEAFKKGEVDIFGMATSTIWNEGCRGEAFDKNWIIKQKVFNSEPMPYQGYAINMRREPSSVGPEAGERINAFWRIFPAAIACYSNV
jgi:microcin C transport system substrate-binding protein